MCTLSYTLSRSFNKLSSHLFSIVDFTPSWLQSSKMQRLISCIHALFIPFSFPYSHSTVKLIWFLFWLFYTVNLLKLLSLKHLFILIYLKIASYSTFFIVRPIFSFGLHFRTHMHLSHILENIKELIFSCCFVSYFQWCYVWRLTRFNSKWR